MAATDAAPRVALLARAGEACDRISGALREAGADVVLVADPLLADPEQVRHATPQAILVALDPAIEDAIDLYADVFADPGYMVIFEEAEQAAQRTGWDAARWLRHLSAKLHRHHDVLPAGAESEEDLHPTPGPLSPTRPPVDFANAIVAFTDEAQQHADEVPSDSGLEGLSGLAAVSASGEDAHDPVAADVAGSWRLPGEEPGDAPVAAAPQGSDDGAALHSPDDAAANGDYGLEPGLAVSPDDAGDGGLDELAFDPERFSRAGQAADAPAGIEEFLAAQAAGAAGESADDGAAEAEAVHAADPPVAEPKAQGWYGGLSLVEDDDGSPAAAASAAPGPAPKFDLDALGAGLSLADPDSYGHGRVRGAILIEAGLGGPDAVRQLLAAIPAGFAKPILIRLSLEGGRYDRLVKQMTRATSASVTVAEAGVALQPGSVYFVPPGLGLRLAGSTWTFDPAVPFEPAAVLPAGDSAVLFLSGADAALVPAVTGEGWSGGLVLGQTPDEGCYEPAATRAAIATGVAHGTPAALAAMLLDRWPVAVDRPDPDPNGMLQP
ncbi:chemotaxis protein CheB [Luteimonas viscosa]|uniref:Chemotaxis protein CheB n=1 Tax=Luteimonas viscosa TaxID=1132694 RepID=A0A5D4XEM9_9GAMM|nr:chemotaxis protein CheB [Luteimonas viscosa]TYT23098.1 chemotaxis protein CheB [Luteimonas viscosa]